MKRGSLLSVLIVLLVLGAGVLGADDITLRLEDFVIETWDKEDSSYFEYSNDDEIKGQPITWEVRGSKFSADGLPLVGYMDEAWPDDLFGRDPMADPNYEGDAPGVLAIKGAFTRQGYNQIELIPGIGSGDDFVPTPIPLPGRVRTVDFWVWGSNYDYYVEVHFMDHMGIPHVLQPVRIGQLREPGSIKFVGWKNMIIDMPNYIKQSVNYKPELANLSLTKIVFTTHPAEIVTEFNILVDHLKVISDMHESFYDGFELVDKMSEVQWKNEE